MWFDDDGWLKHDWVQRQPSPNYDTRPLGTRIDTVVVHCISLPERGRSRQFIEDLFLNRLDTSAHPSFAELQGLHVSSHFLIDRDGSVVQFVGCENRAWHAGVSSGFGRTNFNHFSVGIELLGDVYSPFEVTQIQRLKQLIVELKKSYPLRYAAAHSEIAPGRKTDPGPFFDWKGIRKSTTYELDL
ncbi:MAG: 1,6-anhydro-N-acetylmuramyl-L-alanine amidase AmpD [Limnobacter sp.]|uniref:1,6-anhydro-N-acetylmuramyl-L-alanine amidase AmpD n=1 Tax=Limnobacter sp. TaxID=2003368 RepID=UPI00391985F9